MQTRIYLLVLLLCFGFNFSNAQVNRCGTYELHKQRMETDAQYRAYYSSMGQRVQGWIKEQTNMRTTGVPVIIPVVVHVIYHAAEENISDALIQSQIDILNHDFNATNSDITYVPDVWQNVIGSANLNFCLATRTPGGDYTTGIERKYTSNTSFSDDVSMKYDASGGLNSWDNSQYLNIWVCNLGTSGELGFTVMPSNSNTYASEDGCVVYYAALGNTGNLYPGYGQYNRGRTATHEVGHWLGLWHTWGDDGGACSGTDYIDDTPNQGNNTFGCPSFPDVDNCAGYKDDDSIPEDPKIGVMFMNYMDYTDDACMHLFTADQVIVMHGILNTVRSSILTSTACAAPAGLNEINAETFVDLYPTPANNILHLNVRLPLAAIADVSVYDMLGKKIMTSEVHKTGEQIIDLEVSSLSPGLYTLILNTDQGNIAKRFVISR